MNLNERLFLKKHLCFFGEILESQNSIEGFMALPEEHHKYTLVGYLGILTIRGS